MLHTQAVATELLKVIEQLMQINSLQNFRLVGGSALALQLGHRESIDIDLFSSNDFPSEQICDELTEKFNLNERVRAGGGIMITTRINDVKVDIIDDKKKFIRDAVVENGIRMAHPEEIAAMKIKITCDPFSGRKTQKDLSAIATLLDHYSVKEMIGFFKEKYPTMAPYTENVILQLNKDFAQAERNSKMPRMLNGMTWEKVKQRIEIGLREYFDGLIKEREKKLRGC